MGILVQSPSRKNPQACLMIADRPPPGAEIRCRCCRVALSRSVGHEAGTWQDYGKHPVGIPLGLPNTPAASPDVGMARGCSPDTGKVTLNYVMAHPARLRRTLAGPG